MKYILFCLSIFFSQAAFSLTPIKLALDWYINPDHAPILIAEQQGYFKAQGLNVTLIEPTSSSEARNLVLAHQADLAIDYEPESLIAIGQGLPLVAVGILTPTPLSCLTVLQNTSIKTIKQLKGKIIGYSGGALEATFLNTELQHEKPSLLPLSMNLSQALLSKKVDAVNGMMRNVEPIMLAQMGVQTRLFYPEKNGIPSYAELIFIADKNHLAPKTIHAFMLAVAQGAAYVQTHPQQSYQDALMLYSKELASSPTIKAQNQAIWLASAPYFTSHPQEYSAQNYQDFMNYLVTEKILKQPITYSDFFTGVK
ncbi:MAG: ABC transporter substrate-binding protein [Gammaproteobacteria bacterium]|nr:ABC transporter substrate-binding protein [Gammaproteobacteria bacterium]